MPGIGITGRVPSLWLSVGLNDASYGGFQDTGRHPDRCKARDIKTPALREALDMLTRLDSRASLLSLSTAVPRPGMLRSVRRPNGKMEVSYGVQSLES
jgi:hypothetical protein